MKKISVWKVALLVIVTLGIYAIVWVGRNRDYLARTQKKLEILPRWVWLITIPVVCTVLSLGTFVVSFIAATDRVSVDTAVAYTNLFILVTITYALAIGVWWVWHFSKPMEKVTAGRISQVWSVWLYIFTGPFLVVFYQYYINNPLKNSVPSKPSAGFVAVAVSAITVSACFGGVMVAAYPEVERTTYAELKATQAEIRTTNRNSELYLSCIDRLEVDYPGELTSEDSAAYEQAYQVCDDLYKKYEKSVEQLSD